MEYALTKPRLRFWNLSFSGWQKRNVARITSRARTAPLPEQQAWDALEAQDPEALDVSIVIAVKLTLCQALTCFRREVAHVYTFQRATLEADWQLIQRWEPCQYQH